MKVCTGIDHQSVSSNIKKKVSIKLIMSLDNNSIILRPLSFVQKYTKQKNMKNTGNHFTDAHMIVKVCKRGIS